MCAGDRQTKVGKNMRKVLGIAVAAALAIALAAPALAAAPATQAKAGNFFLSPRHLVVRAGTTVTWTWVSGTHNITVKSGPARWHSPTKSGGTWSHVFRNKGTFILYCQIHPWMQERVVVR
jgi:plastocyanin